MQDDDRSEDERAIGAIVARQFASLDWTPGTSADWDAFSADFLPDASLYLAARPVQRQSIAGLVERMKGLAGSKLRSFREAVLGTEIFAFGNVAVAVAACE